MWDLVVFCNILSYKEEPMQPEQELKTIQLHFYILYILVLELVIALLYLKSNKISIWGKFFKHFPFGTWYFDIVKTDLCAFLR